MRFAQELSTVKQFFQVLVEMLPCVYKDTDMKLKNLLVSLLMLSPLGAAHANDNEVIIKAYFEQQIEPWVSDEALLSAVRVRNVMHKDLTNDDVIAQDKQWRAEVETDTHPLVDGVLKSDAADFLRHRVAEAGGSITEIFVMDAKGLNVAASSATSDYWQGDEPKHSETFVKGVGAMHISDLEVDSSTGLYQVQVSVTLTDPNTNEAIGAITVGLVADAIL